VKLKIKNLVIVLPYKIDTRYTDISWYGAEWNWIYEYKFTKHK